MIIASASAYSLASRGLKEQNMEDVANLIDSVLTNKTSAITLNKLREKVREFISEFTIY